MTATTEAEVGILMRTCDRPPAFLRRSLASVAAQTHRDWRLLILNNGGSEDSIVRGLAASPLAGDPRVRIASLPGPRGPDTIIHEGLLGMGGRILAMHDDDDTWDPSFLARMTSCLARARQDCPEVVAATCWIDRVWERLQGGDPRELRREDYAVGFHGVVLSRLCRRNFLLPLSLVIDREAYLASGGFRTDLPVTADWEFYLRLARTGIIAVEPAILAHYHVRTPGHADEGSGNTVTRRAHDHLQADARIRAEWWRRDPQGLGLLLQIAALEQDALDLIECRTSPFRRIYDRLRSVVFRR